MCKYLLTANVCLVIAVVRGSSSKQMTLNIDLVTLTSQTLILTFGTDAELKLHET